MGYTQFTIDLISRHLEGVKSVVDLGSQNLYAGQYDPNKPPFVSEWYKSKGIEYVSVDLAGDNNSVKGDLSRIFSLTNSLIPTLHPELNQKLLFDLVIDAGTSEHIVKTNHYESVAFHDGYINSIYPKGETEEQDILEGYYNCWANKHNWCERGGLIICENPKTGSWPGHGYSYTSEYFYRCLSVHADLKIIELGEHAAMGNTDTGWNIYCVMQKQAREFIPFKQFKTLPIYRQ